MDISRRDFLKGTTAGVAGIALTGLLGGCQGKEDPSATRRTPPDWITMC